MINGVMVVILVIVAVNYPGAAGPCMVVGLWYLLAFLYSLDVNATAAFWDDVQATRRRRRRP